MHNMYYMYNCTMYVNINLKNDINDKPYGVSF